MSFFQKKYVLKEMSDWLMQPIFEEEHTDEWYVDASMFITSAEADDLTKKKKKRQD